MTDAAPSIFSTRQRTLAVIGLIFVLVVPEIPLPAGGGIAARLAKEAWWVALGAAALFWVTRVEHRPLSSIGLRRPTGRTLLHALALTVLLVASVMLSYAIIIPALGLTMNHTATGGIVAMPAWLQLAIFLRAGIVEEILYRGYPIERLTELTGTRWIAALLPGAAFIGAHFAYWGAAQLIVVAFATVTLTAYYLWKRDLVACMIAHAATDMIGFALANAQM